MRSMSAFASAALRSAATGAGGGVSGGVARLASPWLDPGMAGL